MSERKGYKELMISVLAQAITDYIQAVRVGGINFKEELSNKYIQMSKAKKKDIDKKELREIEAMTKGEEAKCYIFDDDSYTESENYVFGFKFICSFIGMDPEKFRKRIKEKREEFWRDIYAKIKEM